MANSRDNYPVAALRHFRDAELLCENDRKDNAMCHYAFSAECVIKALYEQFCRNQGYNINHSVASAWEDITQYYAALRIFNARTEIMLENTMIPGKLFIRHPGRRYEVDFPYSEVDLTEAHIFTEKLVNELIQELLDGRMQI